jgi:DNA-binding beta-propeller fold protein YncE
LPPNTNTTGWAAGEIILSPNGKYLLASNRHPDLEGILTVFALPSDDTKPLTLVSTSGSSGTTPRSMALSASGNWLAVTNQGDKNGAGSSVAIFAFDQETGKLAEEPQPVYTGAKTPQSVVWLQEKRTPAKVAVSALKQAAVCSAPGGTPYAPGSESGNAANPFSAGTRVAVPAGVSLAVVGLLSIIYA